MIELSGTLIERLNEAIRLVCTQGSEKEVAGFIALYEKAGIELLPSAIDYFKQYGGAYRNSYIMLTDPKRNKDISLNCFDTITDFYYSSAFDPVETEKDMLRRLDWAMDDIETVRELRISAPSERSVIPNLHLSTSERIQNYTVSMNGQRISEYLIRLHRFLRHIFVTTFRSVWIQCRSGLILMIIPRRSGQR